MGLEFVTILPQNIPSLNDDLLVRLPLDYIDRYASWEKLRTFGRLPLFGTSLSALVSIPVIFYLFALYNSQVERLNDHLLGDRLPPGIKHLVETLHPLPLPSLSLWLLISTLLLGVASTIFSLTCPARVREFSLTQWMDDLGKPALHYLANSWSKRWARTIAAPCYFVGGAATALILLIKLWNAREFIWKNSSFGWLS